jgi:Uma2 family endonuclease
MIRRGILTEEDRVELIKGEIVPKMAHGDRHVGSVIRIERRCNRRLGELAIVSTQNPVVLDDDNEPEPDIALLRLREDEYASKKPRAGDVLLLIEVADSSLELDRHTKGPLYARAGIPEYWIVNLIEDKIEVYRDPQLAGRYATVLTFTRGQQIECLAFPGEGFEVAEIL